MSPFDNFVSRARSEAAGQGMGDLEVDGFVLGQLQLEASKRFRRLLAQIGDRAFCRGCGAEIYWVIHSNGKKAPYTVEGLNHFADCPRAADFRSKYR